VSGELIDTTEMYLRTLYELLEEGIDLRRARIVERLHQSGPTVSQTVARMERDGLLVVTPYYSKPSQDGLVGHFTTVADATDLPVMLYDIPGRTGTAIAPETFIRLAEHPRIVAVKDAKGKVVESAQVMAATDLSYYSGDDAITPALLSLGAVGVIGTSTHFTGRSMHQLVDHYLAGRREEGLAVYRQILPVLTGVFAAQGVVMVKAGLAHQGFGVGGVRAPLVPATRSQAETFAAVLDAAGL